MSPEQVQALLKDKPLLFNTAAGAVAIWASDSKDAADLFYVSEMVARCLANGWPIPFGFAVKRKDIASLASMVFPQ